MASDVARVAPVLYEAGCRDFFVAHIGEALHLEPLLPGRCPNLCAERPAARRRGRPAPQGHHPGPELASNRCENWARTAEASRHPPARRAADRQRHVAARPAAGGGDGARGRSRPARRHRTPLPDEPSGERRRIGKRAECRRSSQCLRQRVGALPGLPLCFANSGGIFLGADFHGAMARPGIALYGGARRMGVDSPMRPVVRLDVRVIQTRTVPAGTRVGYGGAHVTTARDAARDHRRRLCRRPAAQPEPQGGRLLRRDAPADRRARVDGQHHDRRHARCRPAR